MAVTISKKAINIREKLAELANRPKYTQQPFWFAGDGVITSFEMPAGWKPVLVFDAGSLQKEGTADKYTVTYDGFVYTVEFAVAPANTNDVGVVGERV